MPAHEQEIEQEAPADGTVRPAPPASVAEHEPAAPAAAGSGALPADDAPAAPAAAGSGALPADDAPAAAAAAVPGPGADPAPDAELDGAALRERAGKADEYLALAQRTQADFENFRKRMTRDVRAAEARGMGRLARELLPALDNLDRALAAVESAEAEPDQEHHFTKGIRLVQAQLSSALARTGIEGYACKGERFDPVQHEAVAQQPVEGAEPGTIVEVLQAGYRLNEAILRPARVIVAG